MKNKLVAAIITIIMLIAMFPAGALADSGTISTNGTYDIGDYGNDALITIDPGLTVTLTNTSGITYTNLEIVCASGVDLTLDGVKIDNSMSDGTAGLSFTGEENALVIKNDSSLLAGLEAPGIHVAEGTELTIQDGGSGVLTVNSGPSCAGIGGAMAESGGEITINSGTINAASHGAAGIGGGDHGNGGIIKIFGGIINASSNGDGAGIGGGYDGDGGTITISGGTVTATCAVNGAGIGGGCLGSGGSITISGGTVTATGGYRAAGIGGGYQGDGGTITIDGGVVFAQKGDTAIDDIGLGGAGSGGTLGISGDAAVFLKNDSSIMPTSNTHKLAVIDSLGDSRISGITLPGTWTTPLYVYLNTGEVDLTITGDNTVFPGGTYEYTVTVSDNAAAILGNVTCGGIFSGESATLSQDSSGGLSEDITATTTITVTVASDANPGDIGTISVAAQESFSDGTRVDERYINGSDSATAAVPSVTYRCHVQNIGWQDWKSNGETAGTSGIGLRLEAINIEIDGESGAIEYRTHVQNIGWQDWVADGAVSGTSGQALRLEAIDIRLTGEMADAYDIYYRVHAQAFGWLDWASNGASAGTEGYGYRLEAIEIVLVPKGGDAPGPTDNVFVSTGPALDGEMDTIAMAQPLGLNVQYCDGINYSGDYDYYTFTPATSGTYRIKTIGDTDTYGYLYHYTSDEGDLPNQLIDTDDTSAEGPNFQFECYLTGGSTYIIKVKGYFSSTVGDYCILATDSALARDISYQSHIQDIGWQTWMSNGAPSGTSGQSKRLEGMRIFIAGQSDAIEYRTHVQNIGWQGWVSDGDMSGTSGLALRLEAIDIRLTGGMADDYDVYYRVHAQNFGWMDWASNGASSGTAGYGYRLEAIEILLVEKGGAAPGPTDTPFRNSADA